jgi:hypothetical protein
MTEFSDIRSFSGEDERRSCPEVRSLLGPKCEIELHSVEGMKRRVLRDGELRFMRRIVA